MKATGGAYDSLPPKRRAFVDAYLKSGNATQAAREAGYKKPKEEGTRLLSFAAVKAALKERGAAIEQGRIMSAQRVLERLSEEAEDCDFAPSRLKALEILAKYHQLLVERFEVENKGGVGVLILPPKKKL
jgi:phage terminase small subunit